MRVVMISKALVVATYRAKLRELARLGVDLTAIVPVAWPEGGGEIFEPAPPVGYDLRRVPVAWSGHFHLYYYLGLDALLSELRPDIVHIDEEPYNLATYLALRATYGLGSRSLFFTWQNLERRYPPPFNWLETRVYRQVDRAIAGSRTAAEVLRHKGYRGDITVVPQFGVDSDRFAPTPRPVRPFTVGFLGRLVPEKGLHDLVSAFTHLSPAARLVIAGDGPQRSELERLIASIGIGDRVVMHRRVPSGDVPDLLHELDVLVLPSRSTRSWKEQFGRALIEAMSCGVAVVGSTCGEIPHVIGDGGLVFPEGDTTTLARTLARLEGDAELRIRLGERGRRRVLARFTHRQIAIETREVYRNMLGSQRSR